MGIRITKVEFQEILSMLLSIILSLAAYINYISYQLKQSYAHKKLCFSKRKIKQIQLIYGGNNSERYTFDVTLISANQKK